MATVIPSEGTPKRVPVNPISGQIGVAGGTGVDSALTQRVSLATNVPLPTGSNVIGHVIVDSGNLIVTNAGTFAVQATLAAETTKVIGTVNVAAGQTIAVTNAGTFVVQATLAAETTKVIGTINVAAGQTIAVTNAGTFATQVTSVIPGTAATNLGKAEDAAHSSADVGVMALFVRNDALADKTNADGDYSAAAVTSGGAVAVAGNDADGATGIHALRTDGGGRLIIQNMADATSYLLYLTGVVNAEDQASSSGDKGIPTLAVRKATPANTSNADGDYENLQISAGRLWTSALLEANSGVDIGDVDVTSIVPGTAATNLGKAEDAPSASGDTGIMALVVRVDSPTTMTNTDGDYTALTVDSAGRLHQQGSYLEDAGANSGERGLFMLAVRNDTAATRTDTDADYSQISVHKSGAVAIAGYDADDSGELQLIRVDNSGNVYVALSANSSVNITGVVNIGSFDHDDTFSSVGNGSSDASYCAKYHSLQVVNAGSVTVWDVRLEGSNNLSTWTQIIQHTNVDLTGTTKQSVGVFAFLYIRTRCAGYTGSGNLIASRHSAV